MTQVTQAFPHLDLETVKQKVKKALSHWERQKWLVIYNAIADPLNSRRDSFTRRGIKRVCQKSNSTIQPQGRSWIINAS
ncbi:hypothetical protein VF14_08640 [Nostoc linckia z18]|jgi:hypothetical protein|uniref:Uncharacterized protein n=2 Tax=Nostoc linckia TaxID=92942 RepID=A0A9Q5ZE94_NOSLI|nr:hypothetical protein [Nostoc linckia]PHK42518.1 hypothetical protein VF12_02285 [Nostoc linckia z15]PHJ57264.1 hypothetical protein VF05_36005 [Nostoc linckia z3]PHJ57340.1 hypothetical protein VF03_36625 [Nostoc linckia z2]PHJ61146.1 hypothetical protein VF02_20365 [Nostoc linckia z1]PHJ71823.1 hypothetical protein VF06_37085 [Nostoc linckia z4]